MQKICSLLLLLFLQTSLTLSCSSAFPTEKAAAQPKNTVHPNDLFATIAALAGRSIMYSHEDLYLTAAIDATTMLLYNGSGRYEYSARTDHENFPDHQGLSFRVTHNKIADKLSPSPHYLKILPVFSVVAQTLHRTEVTCNTSGETVTVFTRANEKFKRVNTLTIPPTDLSFSCTFNCGETCDISCSRPLEPSYFNTDDIGIRVWEEPSLIPRNHRFVQIVPIYPSEKTVPQITIPQLK